MRHDCEYVLNLCLTVHIRVQSSGFTWDRIVYTSLLNCRITLYKCSMSRRAVWNLISFKKELETFTLSIVNEDNMEFSVFFMQTCYKMEKSS